MTLFSFLYKTHEKINKADAEDESYEEVTSNITEDTRTYLNSIYMVMSQWYHRILENLEKYIYH